MEVKGKVAIVTGAGQGIGEAIVVELAKAGAKVALADVKSDTLKKATEKIREMGREALPGSDGRFEMGRGRRNGQKGFGEVRPDRHPGE